MNFLGFKSKVGKGYGLIAWTLLSTILTQWGA